MPSPTTHTLFFGPFRFLSQLPLPELQNTSGSGRLPVTLTLGPTPITLPGAATYGPLCQLTPTQYLLDIPDIARYLVTDGNSIRVTLHAGAPPADVASYLLGSVFGALCHQNQLLPLHASAIATPTGVIAFLGQSGAGKSTLAAALQHRGHTIIADDICLLEPGPTGALHVVPVAGWLKLWRNSLSHLGHIPEEQNRVFAAEDKFRLYLQPDLPTTPLTLKHLVFLNRTEDTDTPPRLDPLSAPEAIAHMMRLTYLGYITELTQAHARVFHQCAHVLTHARPHRLTTPWSLDQLPATLTLVEQLLAKSCS